MMKDIIHIILDYTYKGGLAGRPDQVLEISTFRPHGGLYALVASQEEEGGREGMSWTVN